MIFSQMVDFSTTKDKIIARVTSDTGLPIENVNTLYESFSLICESDQEIVDKFSTFLDSTIRLDSFDDFKTEVLLFAEKIATAEDDATMDQYTIDLIQFTNDYVGSASVDDFTALQMICYLLSGVNRESSVVSQLNESASISEPFSCPEIAANKTFYRGLKDILGRNNRRWGYNNHLSDVYSTIVAFIGEQTENIINNQLYVEKNDSAHLDIINEIIRTASSNPIYRSVDNIKMVVADIQTFVFDCVVLVNNHLTYQPNAAFIQESVVTGYNIAADAVYGAISSSKNGSKILMDKTSETIYNGYTGSNFFMMLPPIDNMKLRMNQPVNARQAAEFIQMIRACSADFKLHDRRTLNNFVTKALEYLMRIEKINQTLATKNL